MEYFKPGFQEFVRVAQRNAHRAQLWLIHRKLDRAETQLGLLGWQQADFDGEIQQQVDALQNIEREQARLTNRSADFARTLKDLGEARAKQRSEHDAARKVLEDERTLARQPLPDLERQLEAAREAASDPERRTSQLDKESRDVDQQYNKLLLIQPQTGEIRDEILKLRDRLIAIPNEKNDLRIQHARGLAVIQQCERQIQSVENRVAEIEEKLRAARDSFEEQDAALAKSEQQAEKAKESSEAEGDRMERAKSNPYMEIGRVLADHRIAPMNQPDALTTVLNLRSNVALGEAAIADLRRISGEQDPSVLRMSFALWAVVFAALGLTVASMM